jgi:RNA polymerase sigma factor (sigma-70 family)
MAVESTGEGRESLQVVQSDTLDLVDQFRQGSESAAEELFDRFAGRLAALAAAQLPTRLSRRLDSEDIVQSVFRSFFLAAKEPRYVLTRSGDLWRLLVAMTINKLHGQVAFHSAQKRNVAREEGPEVDLDRIATPLLQREPTAEEAVALSDLLEEATSDLDSRRCRVLELRLQEFSYEEIAAEVGLSERTVRRYLDQFRQRLYTMLFDPNYAAPRSVKKAT